MMGKWLPQSLFSRMIFILLFGLILAQALNRSIHLYQHSVKAEQLSKIQGARRVADLIRIMSVLTPDMQTAVAKQFRDPDLFIRLLNKPLQANRTGERNNPRFKLFAQALNVFLFEQHPQRLIISEDAPMIFTVQAQLSDHTTLQAEIRLRQEHEDGLSIFLYLAIVQFTITLFSFFAVRWVTRPLEKLANAAEELGRDIHRPPLEENGPIEVSQAARAFNTMQASLIRHIQDRTQLLAAISHDLKTPITRLRLRSELLNDSDMRARIQKDLDEMEYMVRVTLDYMRGVDQQEMLQPVDMMSLLESLQADAQEMQAQVEIIGTLSAPYLGKPTALKRCISNLLDNAIKYGQRATISVEEDEAFCVLRISDQGQGIPEELLTQVLTPYYRVESSRNRDSGGTGLGLSIAKDIAHAHGGSLVLHNAPQGGLEAVLTLAKQINHPTLTPNL